jgi:hypothetical protein
MFSKHKLHHVSYLKPLLDSHCPAIKSKTLSVADRAGVVWTLLATQTSVWLSQLWAPSGLHCSLLIYHLVSQHRVCAHAAPSACLILCLPVTFIHPSDLPITTSGKHGSTPGWPSSLLTCNPASFLCSTYHSLYVYTYVMIQHHSPFRLYFHEGILFGFPLQP